MTTRDIQNQIVINLLKFKSHLEYLLKEAFSSDQYFLKTLRKVLEDVLNQGDSDLSQEHNVMSTTNRRKKNSFRHSGDDYDGGNALQNCWQNISTCVSRIRRLVFLLHQWREMCTMVTWKSSKFLWSHSSATSKVKMYLKHFTDEIFPRDFFWIKVQALT